MSDDRWRDSYDSWKLATPPEYEITPEEEDRRYRGASEERAQAIVMTEAQERQAVEIVRHIAEGWHRNGYLDTEGWGMGDLRNLLAEISDDQPKPIDPTPDIQF